MNVYRGVVRPRISLSACCVCVSVCLLHDMCVKGGKIERNEKQNTPTNHPPNSFCHFLYSFSFSPVGKSSFIAPEMIASLCFVFPLFSLSLLVWWIRNSFWFHPFCFTRSFAIWQIMTLDLSINTHTHTQHTLFVLNCSRESLARKNGNTRTKKNKTTNKKRKSWR